MIRTLVRNHTGLFYGLGFQQSFQEEEEVKTKTGLRNHNVVGWLELIIKYLE